MRISTTAWLIIILVLIAIGEGLYIYYTRPVPTPDISKIIAESKLKDSLISQRDEQIVNLTTRLVISEMQFDDIYKQRKGLSESLNDAGTIINNLSDSLDSYRSLKDTPRFVVACDTLQIKADSLVIRTQRMDSIIKVGDSFVWLIGRQKDSVNDVLHDQVNILKAHDSASTKGYVDCSMSSEKEKKKDDFLRPIYIGGGITIGVAGTIWIYNIIKK